MSLSTLGFAALVLAVEASLLAWLVPAFLLRRSRRAGTAAAAAEQAGVSEMFEDVEGQEPARREALSTIFATTYNMAGEALERRVDEFLEREQAFYQVMTSVYLERDPERLKEIPEELTKVVSPWVRLTPENVVGADAVEDLEARNETLQSELDQTRKSMDELMAEYTAAFERARAAEARAGDGAAEAEPAPDAGDETAPGDAGAAAAGNVADAGAVPDEPADGDVEELAFDTGGGDVESAAAAPQRESPVTNASEGGEPKDGETADDELGGDELSQDDIDKLFAAGPDEIEIDVSEDPEPDPEIPASDAA